MAKTQGRSAIEDIGAGVQNAVASPIGRAVGRGGRAVLDYAYNPDTLLRAASVIPNPAQFPAAIVQRAADIARFAGVTDTPAAPAPVAVRGEETVPGKGLADFVAADAGTVLPRKHSGKEVAKDLTRRTGQVAPRIAPEYEDLAAIREQMQADAKRLGRPVAAGSIAVLDKIENARRDLSLRGRGQDFVREVGLAGVAQKNRATDIQSRINESVIANANVDAATRAQLTFLQSISDDMTIDPEARDKARGEIATIFSNLKPAIGFGEGAVPVQRNADGGEILPPDEVGVVPPELPPAVSEAPLPLDSGDYIVPIEAMRFYGRKFFQDLINKAEDVG